MKLAELESELLALNLSEKAELISFLTGTISNKGRKITKTPGICGGDACIFGTRLPVWLFVSLRKQGATDAQLLECYPHLNAADLVNVWAYTDAHFEEIEIALKEQQEAIKLT